MFYLFFLLFVLLSLGLFFSVVRTGNFTTWAKAFRISVVAFSIAIFTYYFVTKSLTPFLENSLTVQVINKLPFPLDFYIIKVNEELKSNDKYETAHLGNIRNDYYRIEHLDMKISNEFWVVGFMGQKNLTYFSQHSVPNNNVDQIIEVKNYINQSAKLSAVAKTLIEEMKFENIKTSIWITLDLLLLFLNFALLLRKFRKVAYIHVSTNNIN